MGRRRPHPPAATGTETYELNRNLVLTDGPAPTRCPTSRSRPARSSAPARERHRPFDDEQLFYLCSRGIDAETARRLVVRGFFADVVEKIGVPALADRLMGSIEQRLGALPGLEEQETPRASCSRHELPAGLRAERDR